MIKIRLARFGNKTAPFYRIVAIDEQKKGRGKALEILGYWHPKKGTLSLDKVKVKNWVNNGAKLSKAVTGLFNK